MHNKKRFLLVFVLLLVFLLALAYVSRDRESKTLDDNNRALLGGNYITLNKGVVHYEFAEKEMSNKAVSKTVVLVHGFSVPYYVFDPTFEFLQEDNFRVLRFDLFGRGLSDRIPDSDYALDLYVEQLHDLLNALEIHAPVQLVGLSMGGAIVTHFVNKYPERVDKVALLAPLFHTPERPEVALMNFPYLGEYLGKVVLVPKLINGASATVYDPASFPDWQEKFSPQTEYRGFSQALVQTLRYLSGRSFKAEYEKLGTLNKPVLLIWGRQDRVIPFSDHEQVLSAVPGVQFHAIDQAGHLPHYEQADQVNKLLADFLSTPADMH